ncbi:MAG: ATP-binding cassette domain-containing protein [Ilumatobacteraceae bacterium]
MPATLTLQDVSVSRAARRVLDHVDLVVPPGARLGVVGPNGVGKTTLLAVAACAVTPERGTVRLAPPTATVGWLHQEPERTGELVRDLLDRRTGVAAAQAELDAATEALAGTAAHADAAEAADAADRYDVALQRWLALGAADLHSRIGQVADELGMSARLLDQPVASLSGGEAARVGLAALMLSRFDVYLLDEPTNDLDLDGLDRLERWVLGLDAGVLLVSHDRHFLDRVVTDVVELDEFSHRHSVRRWVAGLPGRARANPPPRVGALRGVRRQAQLAGLRPDPAGVGPAGCGQGEAADEGRAGQEHPRLQGQPDRAARRQSGCHPAPDRAAGGGGAARAVAAPAGDPHPGRSGDIVARLVEAVVDRGDFRLGPIDLLVEVRRADRAGRCGCPKPSADRPGHRSHRAGHGHGAGSVAVWKVGEIEQVRRQLHGAATLVRSFVDATGMTVPDARTLLAKFGLVGATSAADSKPVARGRTRAALALLMANGRPAGCSNRPTNHLDRHPAGSSRRWTPSRAP